MVTARISHAVPHEGLLCVPVSEQQKMSIRRAEFQAFFSHLFHTQISTPILLLLPENTDALFFLSLEN